MLIIFCVLYISSHQTRIPNVKFTKSEPIEPEFIFEAIYCEQIENKLAFFF